MEKYNFEDPKLLCDDKVIDLLDKISKNANGCKIEDYIQPIL